MPDFLVTGRMRQRCSSTECLGQRNAYIFVSCVLEVAKSAIHVRQEFQIEHPPEMRLFDKVARRVPALWCVRTIK